MKTNPTPNPNKSLEEWLPYTVPPFDGKYEVSSAGRVRRNGKILAQSSSNSKKDNWYRVITIHKDNVGKTMRVHRLVAQTFLANPEGKPQVNHLDGNKTNNNVSNLAWATAAENERHSFDVLGKVPSRKGQGKVVEFNCHNCDKPCVKNGWRAKENQRYCSRQCANSHLDRTQTSKKYKIIYHVAPGISISSTNLKRSDIQRIQKALENSDGVLNLFAGDMTKLTQIIPVRSILLIEVKEETPHEDS